MEQVTIENLLNEIVLITGDIYNSIGPGYNEVVYHRAFEVALRLKGFDYQSEVVTPIVYHNHVIGHGRVDIIVKNTLILELKAIANLNNMESVIQIKNYMKQHNILHGAIINFGQCNTRNVNGRINIKYVTPTQVFNFENGSFTPEQI